VKPRESSPGDLLKFPNVCHVIPKPRGNVLAVLGQGRTVKSISVAMVETAKSGLVSKRTRAKK
jgi:hypothetical protein